MRLDNKSIVVTGASSGMGDAIVRRFVAEGANVVAVARRKERLENLAADTADQPGRVVPFPGDVSKNETNEGMIDLAISEFGRLDAVVNNAGIMDHMDPIDQVTDDLYNRVMAINVYGPMCSMRKAVKVFREQGDGGSIVNVSSAGAIKAAAGPIYGASKAAVCAMTRNTAYMFNADKIRVNAILPGGFATEITTSMGKPNSDGYARIKKIIDSSPALGEVSDIANAALFLVSDESKYVSGVLLPVDGGFLAG